MFQVPLLDTLLWLHISDAFSFETFETICFCPKQTAARDTIEPPMNQVVNYLVQVQRPAQSCGVGEESGGEQR